METCAIHGTQDILESASLRVSQCLQQAENSKVSSRAYERYLRHTVLCDIPITLGFIFFMDLFWDRDIQSRTSPAIENKSRYHT